MYNAECDILLLFRRERRTLNFVAYSYHGSSLMGLHKPTVTTVSLEPLKSNTMIVDYSTSGLAFPYVLYI